MSSKLKTYLRSSYAALYAVTFEEERIIAEIQRVCGEIKFSVFTWSPTDGLVNPLGQRIEKFGDDKTRDPIVVLRAFCALKAQTKKDSEPEGSVVPNLSVLVLKDFHLYLQKRDPVLTRAVKDSIAAGRITARSIMVMACQLALPAELEKEFTVVDFPLPTRAELQVLAEDLAKDKKTELNGNIEAILEAGVGLTCQEFADAAAASLTDHNAIIPHVVADIKAATIKKGGILEIVKPGVTFDNIGGMHEVKAWIGKRRHAFGDKAREYGLPMPKGVLLFGVMGAGKSFLTRAIAHELDCPLIRLDTGRLFGGLVGQSEGNVRSVISQVEAFGRCVLQIDEIDKGFAGMVGGHDGDSGTTRRVIGSFLTWMAEKTSPVFIVATANDLSKLPPELLRKGRWDEMFFIDLPTVSERVEIWNSQIKMKNRKPAQFDLEQLAEATDKWTGAEIEAVFAEALFAAFDEGKQPSTKLLLDLIPRTVPLSATAAEQIEALRQWAKDRCRPASAPQKETALTTKGRKFVS